MDTRNLKRLQVLSVLLLNKKLFSMIQIFIIESAEAPPGVFLTFRGHIASVRRRGLALGVILLRGLRFLWVSNRGLLSQLHLLRKGHHP